MNQPLRISIVDLPQKNGLAFFGTEGIFDYLCKPVEPQTLFEKIEKARPFFSSCERVTD